MPALLRGDSFLSSSVQPPQFPNAPCNDGASLAGEKFPSEEFRFLHCRLCGTSLVSADASTRFPSSLLHRITVTG